MPKPRTAPSKPDVPDSASPVLTDYEAQLIACVRKLPAPDRANVSRSIAYFCLAAADGFRAGGYSEGVAA